MNQPKIPNGRSIRIAAVAVFCSLAGATHVARAAEPEDVLIQNATVWTQGPEGIIEGADVLIRSGSIVEVAVGIRAPNDIVVIDGTGKHVTPGLIDAHSHIAMRGSVNEGSNTITAETRVEDVIDPTDVSIYRHLAGGLTAAHILHGSANSIGGQDAVIKLHPNSTAPELLVEGRKGIKFALGENPKQSNMSGRENTSRYPKTRMGVMESIRRAFIAAENYDRENKAYESLAPEVRNRREPPRRDLQLEAILEILQGERKIHCHAYRQDEMLAMMRLAEDFGITIQTFDHGLEGYKIADEISEHGAGVTTQSDWWGYKLEAYDATPYNGALLTDRGVTVSFSSDSPELARRLNLEAAKAVKYGGLDEQEALACITNNAARQLEIGARTGTLEPGKDADVVLWSGHPLSVYSIAEKTWVDGVREFDRETDLAGREAIDIQREELINEIRGQGTPTAEIEDPVQAAVIPPQKPLIYFDRLAALGESVSIVGATVHTMVGDPIENGTVSFRNGRIVEVAAGSQPMAGAQVIDATGKHVYPGLIDVNSVIGLTEISSVAASVDISETGDLNPALNTAIAVNPDSELLPVTRANGLTHVLTVPRGGLVSGTSSLIRLDGWTWEDLFAATPAAMHITWPAFRERRGWFGPSQSTGDLDKKREAQLKTIRTLVEDARAYGIAKTADTNEQPPFEVDPVLEAMLPVLSGELPIIVHADDVRQIKSAVAWAQKEGLRMILAGRADTWRVADLLAAKDIPVIITNVLALPARRDEPYDTAFTTAAKLYEAGVRFCIAGSANSFSAANTRNLPYQSAMAAAFGLPRDEALKAVTLYPAQILGVGDELGSIEAGKSASLIITNGDPLEIRTTIERVFIDGRETDLATRHTRLFEKYAARPEVE